MNNWISLYYMVTEQEKQILGVWIYNSDPRCDISVASRCENVIHGLNMILFQPKCDKCDHSWTWRYLCGCRCRLWLSAGDEVNAKWRRRPTAEDKKEKEEEREKLRTSLEKRCFLSKCSLEFSQECSLVSLSGSFVLQVLVGLKWDMSGMGPNLAIPIPDQPPWRFLDTSIFLYQK